MPRRRGHEQSGRQTVSETPRRVPATTAEAVSVGRELPRPSSAAWQATAAVGCEHSRSSAQRRAWSGARGAESGADRRESLPLLRARSSPHCATGHLCAAFATSNSPPWPNPYQNSSCGPVGSTRARAGHTMKTSRGERQNEQKERVGHTMRICKVVARLARSRAIFSVKKYPV